MNVLERFWSLFSRDYIATLKAENNRLKSSLAEANERLREKDEECIAEVAYVSRTKDAYWQSKFEAFKREVQTDLASMSDTLAQFQCKEVCDATNHKDS